VSERAFIRTIVENPDDDTARLVFADWLDERDDPRGPFIRTQCELARLAPDDRREDALRAEESRLSGPAIAAFVRSVPETLVRYYDPYYAGSDVYHRGLLDSVRLTPDDALEHFLLHAPELFEFAPIQTLHLQPVLEDWGDIHRDSRAAVTPVEKVRCLLQLPCLERVRSLVLCSPFEDLDAVSRLVAECPHLRSLLRLSFKRGYSDGSLYHTGMQGLLPASQELLRARFGSGVSW
jgi:uncharacterized protein (TIGR02996 family)